MIGPSERPSYLPPPRQVNITLKQSLIVIGIMLLLVVAGRYILLMGGRATTRTMICGTHLAALGRAFLVYASENGDKFPPPDKWCDLLLEDDRITEETFKCPYMKKGRCSYSMNPNADMAAVSGKRVLLFETNAGWNSFGGPELLTAENHDGIGCNILFVDGSVEFIRKDSFDKLLWGRRIDRQNR
jgi:prepilin-type processing-associated H-X9-DG protein